MTSLDVYHLFKISLPLWRDANTFSQISFPLRMEANLFWFKVISLSYVSLFRLKLTCLWEWRQKKKSDLKWSPLAMDSSFKIAFENGGKYFLVSLISLGYVSLFPLRLTSLWGWRNYFLVRVISLGYVLLFPLKISPLRTWANTIWWEWSPLAVFHYFFKINPFENGGNYILVRVFSPDGVSIHLMWIRYFW